MWLLVPILLSFHVLVCLLLVLVILMQLPRSEGLGAAFGGGMTENIFGAQTTHVLARFTVWLGVAFFVLTLLLAIAYARNANVKASDVQKELMAAPVPQEAPATPGVQQDQAGATDGSAAVKEEAAGSEKLAESEAPAP